MQNISFRDDILPLKDKLFRLALRITLNRAEAEDVVQDTLIRVWSKREEWVGLESVEAYCMSIARNLAIDRSRKAGKQELRAYTGNSRASGYDDPRLPDGAG